MHRKTAKKTNKRPYHKHMLRRLSKGTASPNLFIILFIILLLFFGSFFVVNNSPLVNNPRTQTGMVIPTGGTETGGGLRTLELSPMPTLASSSAQKCNFITNDIVLVIDKSGSMRGVKLEEAKLAAQVFVALIAVNPQSRVGLVSFDKTSTLMQPLSNDYSAVAGSIDTLSNGSNTCIQCGALEANNHIAASLRENVKRSVVLLSDGRGNHVDGKRNSNANSVALTEAIKGHNNSAVSYYSIAFGDDADTKFMNDVASSTGGTAYATLIESELTNAFSLVASDICEP